MEVGMVGLGRMGGNMARRLARGIYSQYRGYRETPGIAAASRTLTCAALCLFVRERGERREEEKPRAPGILGGESGKRFMPPKCRNTSARSAATGRAEPARPSAALARSAGHHPVGGDGGLSRQCGSGGCAASAPAAPRARAGAGGGCGGGQRARPLRPLQRGRCRAGAGRMGRPAR